MKHCPQCSTGYPDSHTTCPNHVVSLNKMHTGKRTGWLLALLIAIMVLPALSQQDEGPILRPRVQPVKPTGATLLVICDLACNWNLDGVAKGRIEAGGSAKAKVELGQHLVVAMTEDEADQVKQLCEVKTTVQTVVSIEFKAARDARLKSEQEARDKVDQEVRDRAAYNQKRYEEDRLLFEKDCDNGKMLSCTGLGVLYDNGWGVSRDYSVARKLYQKACDGEEMRGCRSLGLLYSLGNGVSQDYSHARKLYQKACDGGDMPGCHNLGLLYAQGNGVSQDYAQARTLFQKACDGGELAGCSGLGVAYAEGQGVTQDYAQARMLFKKACDGGEKEGCNNFGWLYQNGLGVEKDIEKAKQLFNEGCTMGCQKACDNLKKMQ